MVLNRLTSSPADHNASITDICSFIGRVGQNSRHISLPASEKQEFQQIFSTLGISSSVHRLQLVYSEVENICDRGERK